jgi:hypothetical protein
LKKRSLGISAIAAMVIATALAGCGSTTYFAGRNLPPSGLTHRVLIAVQNPSAFSKGALEIVDAFYDIRSAYNGTPASFAVGSFGGALPVSIQNMPEEQRGAVYSAGDGTLSFISYQTEKAAGSASGLSGFSSSIYTSRSGAYIFAANEQAHLLTVINQGGGSSAQLSLPGVYRVSMNPGGSAALAFVQNSDYAYYPVQLTVQQGIAYSGGSSTWPKASEDCEPQNAPTWCLFQAQSPDALDATGSYYGKPLKFDRPVKAVWSADGSTAYVLNCGPECGGVASSYSVMPVAPLIFTLGKNSGLLPCNAAPCANSDTSAMTTVSIPGGASNALVDTTTMYVVGQKPQIVNGITLFGGNLTEVNLANNTASTPVAISDGQPGSTSRMIEADDNTLWVAMSGCTNGVRYESNSATGYGCLTMYNTSTHSVTLLEPYLGNATGIAAVTGLHKLYAAIGGQVYIYNTVDGSSIDNQYVTVTGTAYDVAYMDAVTDTNNTVY